MFHDTHPDGCPTDLLEKQSFLRAHALLALLNGQGGPSRASGNRRCRGPHRPVTGWSGGARLDWGVPMSICPGRVLRPVAATSQGLFDQKRSTTVSSSTPPGELNLGRTTRLANRAQRRALHGRCTPRVRSRVVVCATRAPNCTTSSGGATAAGPISTICCRCARNITSTRSTTTAGSSPSDPTANSQSHSPTDKS